MRRTTATAVRTATVLRYAAAGCAVILCMLWFFGICTLPLPADADPRLRPSGYAAAQLLLFLPVLLAAKHIFRHGAKALSAGKVNAAAVLTVSAAAALADSVFAVLYIALAVGRGETAAASDFALTMPTAFLGGTLACTALAARSGDLPRSRFFTRACRFLLLFAVAAAVLAFGIKLSNGAGAAAALHAALLSVSLCSPAALLLTEPMLRAAAKKEVSFSLSCKAFETIGAAAALRFADAAPLREAAPSLDDLYAVGGNKPALLATAAALAGNSAASYAGALSAAADLLGLRMPRTAAALCTADGFCGRVHGHTWRFSADLAAAPEIIRRTDFGDRQTLCAFADGDFRGVLLFAKQPSADAGAALDCLCDNGLAVSAHESGAGIPAAFLHARREKVLHAAREGATIKLTDADGTLIVSGLASLTELAATVLRGRRVTAALRAAAAISVATVLLCLPAAVGALPVPPATAFAGISAVRLAAAVSVLLLSLWVRRFRPPEIQPSKEKSAMFGKVNYTIHVEGMSCSHCAAHVKTALESIRGVSASVELDEKVAHVKCPAALDEKQLADAVTEAGFTVASVERV